MTVGLKKNIWWDNIDMPSRISRVDYTEWWRGYGTSVIPWHRQRWCGWASQENSYVAYLVKCASTIRSSSSSPKYSSEKWKHRPTRRLYMFMQVFITVLPVMKRWVSKQTLVFTHSGLLLVSSVKRYKKGGKKKKKGTNSWYTQHRSISNYDAERKVQNKWSKGAYLNVFKILENTN